MKQDTRPINVGIGDLMAFRWPVTAIASIAHRIAGAVLFVGIGFMLFALQVSLDSEEGFNTLKGLMTSPLGKFITWGLLSALAYHFVAGLKHLRADGVIGTNERVACVLTGHALKDPDVTVNYHKEKQGEFANPPIEAPNDLDAIIKLIK